MTKIENEGFRSIAAVTVIIPPNVTSIGSLAFADCPYLSDVYIPAKTTFIAQDAFVNTNKITIHGSKDSYAATYARGSGIDFVSE